MSSTASTAEPTPEVPPNQPGLEGILPLPGGVEALPPPTHIYDIPPHLRRLVTLNLSVIHDRRTTRDDLRDVIKCFYHTIPRIRLECKAKLIDAFLYYVVPILRRPHVFDRERGIIYSFDVPFQIELEEEPEAGDLGNENNNTGVDQDAA